MCNLVAAAPVILIILERHQNVRGSSLITPYPLISDDTFFPIPGTNHHDREMNIRTLTPEVTIFNSPFNRFGLFKIGARATAIKLQNADVVVVSAIKSTSKIEETLASLGKVKYIVAPDREHHLQLEEYAKLYPDAKLIGVEGVPEKHPNLKFHKIFGDKKYDDVRIGWEDEIETCYFPGHINKELAIFHKKSKSLVEADLLFNLPGYEQYENSSSSAGIMGWLSPFRFLKADSLTHKRFNWYMAGEDRTAMKASLDRMSGWDFDRIIPCHGEVIETNGKRVWDGAFSYYFDQK